MKYFLPLIFLVFGIRALAQNPGDLDFTFNPKDDGTYGSGPNNFVNGMVRQPDGKILVYGYHSTFNKVSTGGLNRMYHDGALDHTFRTSVPLWNVSAVVLLPSGKIIVNHANGVLRLFPDGRTDTSFKIHQYYGRTNFLRSVGNGMLLLAGNQQAAMLGNSAVTRKYIIRIDTNGILDTSYRFTAPLPVHQIAEFGIFPNGKALVIGRDQQPATGAMWFLTRVNQSGRRDTGFSHVASNNYTAERDDRFELLPDGRFLIRDGFFQIYKRMRANGEWDPTYHQSNSNFMPDLKIIYRDEQDRVYVSGAFTHYNGFESWYLVRLLPNGLTDHTFVNHSKVKPFNAFLFGPDTVALGGSGGCLWGGASFIRPDGIKLCLFSKFTGSQVEFSGKAPAIAQLSSGKIIISDGYNGISSYYFNSILLDQNGEIHTDSIFFNPGFSCSPPETYLEQSDGKIIIGGGGISTTGVNCARIGRTLPNGTFDTTFKYKHIPNSLSHVCFTQKDRVAALMDNRLRRFHQDGRIDSSFLPQTWYGAFVAARDSSFFACRSVGDSLAKVDRILSNGLIDTSFDLSFKMSYPGNWGLKPANDSTYLIWMRPSYSPWPERGTFIYKFSREGKIDSSFSNGKITKGIIKYLTISPKNGSIAIMGEFDSIANSRLKNICLLNANGVPNPDFTPGKFKFYPVNSDTNTILSCRLSFQNDGKLLVSGSFYKYNGAIRNGVMRIWGDSTPPPPPDGNMISGQVFRNIDNNCRPDSLEKGISFRIIRATPGPYWTSSSQDGKYSIKTDKGNYSINQMISPRHGLSEIPFCPGPDSTRIIAFGDSLGKTKTGIDFSNSVLDCPVLGVTVSTARLRFCSKGKINVDVSNTGYGSGNQVIVKLKLPHYVSFVSADYPVVFQEQDSVWIFTIDEIPPRSQRSITITDSVACQSGIMGLEQCIKAWINEANTCLPTPIGWDGTNLVVKGLCNGLSSKFIIKNTGASMIQSREYRLFADSLLSYADTFRIDGGDSIVLLPVVQGQHRLRLEVNQAEYHPYQTIAYNETNCHQLAGSSFFQYPEESIYTSAHCLPIRGSYDPNDKQVWPKGSTPAGLVPPNRVFQFKIRFQNVGTDTAFRVVLIDTLDQGFDYGTLQMGSSSHPYQVEISGIGKAILRIWFPNIQLPDSTTNSVASQGYIDFTIRHLDSLPLGSVLKNYADIYFDQNSPKRTNTTTNTLYKPTLQVGPIDTVILENVLPIAMQTKFHKIFVYPNPTAGKCTVVSSEPVRLTVRDVIGKELLRSPAKKSHELDLTTFQDGIYLLQVYGQDNSIMYKLVKEL